MHSTYALANDISAKHVILKHYQNVLAKYLSLKSS